MSDPSKPFAFTDFVPGFDFLKNLTMAGTGSAGNAAGAGNAAAAGLTGLSSWIAPTLSVEEVDKRIKELKTVQFWLEQNLHALKATIQALEVQRMTLSTLKGMNVQMEDLAKAFSRGAALTPLPVATQAKNATSDRSMDRRAVRSAMFEPAPKAAPTPAEEHPAGSETSAQDAAQPNSESAAPAPSAAAPGLIDPMQWWGALTQQFEQIASSALRDAAALKMPGMLEPGMMKGATKKRAASADAMGAASSKVSKARATTGRKTMRKTAQKTVRKPVAKSTASRRSASGAG